MLPDKELFHAMCNDTKMIKRVDSPDNDLVIFTAAKAQISPKTEVQELAKGIVFNKDGRIVSIPYKKMYNWHEKQAVRDLFVGILNNDDASLVSQEKVDGTLIHVFFYKEKWHVTTRGAFNSEFITIAKELLNRQVVASGHSLLDLLYEDLTYLFELVSPENKIITDYNGQTFLAFLGVNHDDQEYILAGKPKFISEDFETMEFAEHIRFPLPQEVNKDDDVDWRWTVEGQVSHVSLGSDLAVSEGVMLKAVQKRDGIMFMFRDVFFDSKRWWVHPSVKTVLMSVKVKTDQYISQLRLKRELSMESVFNALLTSDSDHTDADLFCDYMSDRGLPEELLPDCRAYAEIYFSLKPKALLEWANIFMSKELHYEEGFEKRYAVWIKQNVDKDFHKYHFLHMRNKDIDFNTMMVDVFLPKAKNLAKK